MTRVCDSLVKNIYINHNINKIINSIPCKDKIDNKDNKIDNKNDNIADIIDNKTSVIACNNISNSDNKTNSNIISNDIEEENNSLNENELNFSKINNDESLSDNEDYYYEHIKSVKDLKKFFILIEQQVMVIVYFIV